MIPQEGKDSRAEGSRYLLKRQKKSGLSGARDSRLALGNHPDELRCSYVYVISFDATKPSFPPENAPWSPVPIARQIGQPRGRLRHKARKRTRG